MIPLPTLVAVAAAAPLVLLCLRDPLRYALPLFALLIPFGGRLSLGPSPFLSLPSLAGLLLVLSLVLNLGRSGHRLTRLSPAVPIWLFFLATATLGTLWTLDLDRTVTGIAVLGSLVVLYVLVALTPVDATAVRRTENALVVGASAAVVYGLVQLTLLGGFPARGTGEAGVGGRFGDDLLGANLQAVSMLLPLLISVDRAGSPEWRGRWRVLHAVTAGLMCIGIVMTASRGGQVAAAVALVVLAVSGRRAARSIVLGAVAVGAALAAFVWTAHPFGLAERSFESVTSSSGRMDIWIVGMSACEEYCLPGSGWGTFPAVYADQQALVPGARVLVGGGEYEAHSVWLLVLIELGALGLLLFLGALFVAFREAGGLPATRRGPPLGALAGIVVGLSFLSSLEFKFFWMTLAYVTLLAGLPSRVEPLADPPGRAPLEAADER